MLQKLTWFLSNPSQDLWIKSAWAQWCHNLSQLPSSVWGQRTLCVGHHHNRPGQGKSCLPPRTCGPGQPNGVHVANARRPVLPPAACPHSRCTSLTSVAAPLSRLSTVERSPLNLAAVDLLTKKTIIPSLSSGSRPFLFSPDLRGLAFLKLTPPLPFLHFLS
jgi:hypothetical protein